MQLKLLPARGKAWNESTATESRAPKGYFQYGIDGTEGVVWIPAHWLADPHRPSRTIDVTVPGMRIAE